MKGFPVTVIRRWRDNIPLDLTRPRQHTEPGSGTLRSGGWNNISNGPPKTRDSHRVTRLPNTL